MPARTCSVPRCPLIIPDGQRYREDCDKCKERAAAAAPWARKRERLSFYSTARWQKLRAFVLRTYPMCQECKRALATEVHHIESATKDNPHRWFDLANLLALCHACHVAITSRRARENKSAHT